MYWIESIMDVMQKLLCLFRRARFCTCTCFCALTVQIQCGGVVNECCVSVGGPRCMLTVMHAHSRAHSRLPRIPIRACSQ